MDYEAKLEATETAYELVYAIRGGMNEGAICYPGQRLSISEAAAEIERFAKAAQSPELPDSAEAAEAELASRKRISEGYRQRVVELEVELAALKASGDWIKGEPPSPWNTEWFFAKLKNGEYAVLHRLPEEYSYDYKTADETYLKKDNIVAWMQIPDSEFIKPAPSAEPDDELDIATRGPWKTIPPDWPEVNERIQEMAVKLAARRPGVEPVKISMAMLRAIDKEWRALDQWSTETQVVARLNAVANRYNVEVTE